MHEVKYPVFATIHHIPNGGARSASQGARLKASGVRAGVWDILVPFPRVKVIPGVFKGGSGGYTLCGGLYVEMKAPALRKKGDDALTDAQKAFRAALSDNYAFTVAFDWLQAVDAILGYLGISNDEYLRYSLPARKEPVK